MWLLVLVLLVMLLAYRWYRQSQILENLSDKYVFITGCDTGFGNVLAKQLDKRGMKVLASCLTEKGAENLKKETSSRLKTTILDISDSKNVSDVADWVSRIVGDKGLWGLVNNAAIPGQMAPLGWQKKNDFVKVLEVNVLGFIDVTLTLLPLIRKTRGRIVNVSSIVGRMPLIPGGYNLSKYCVENFSDLLRQELNDFGVKVSIVEPGAFNTALTILPYIKKSMEEKWQMLPAETKKIYGEQYLRKHQQNMEQLVTTSSPKSYLVTNCIEHALTACHPWTRYSAGLDAKLFYIPLSYFPTFIIDYMASRNAPKPAQGVH
ncbi:retinol dehydrogenase 7-like [Hyla sarda]|uniref:retinol dehydrogenase 7-like n=1 Tax=Hyla sarda TaxID=327740 RepID=UPI0024C41DE4|nr:retinol dehydrogenase 7-like [Hyla sarda]XP_056418460.1 retinol dehydrogenase 7-like [Hyla sarda]XP_056418461.1 retinol dehydrogenase 7-like [Hyla sarda]